MLPFTGSGSVLGRVGPLLRRRWGLEAPAQCCRVLEGGGGFPTLQGGGSMVVGGVLGLSAW